MSTPAFIVLISENVNFYIFTLLFLFIAYRMLFYKTVNSIYDPIAFYIIFSNAICSANVWFMAYVKQIPTYYLTSYILSESALLLGLLLFVQRPGMAWTSAAVSSPRLHYRLKQGMRLAFFIILATNLTIYMMRGIPLLLASRSEASTGGSGFGMFTRISQNATLLLILFYYSKARLPMGKATLVEKSYLVISAFLGFLSGYKAFFINYLFAYYIFNFDRTSPLFTRKTLLVLGAGTITMLVLFMIVMGTTDLNLVLFGLTTRIVASGDVYYMGYLNDSLKHLPPPHFINQLFGSTLASLRLIDWTSAPQNLGIALNQVVNNYETIDGPTFRYNMLWQYSTNSIILTTLFSFSIGALIGWLNRMVHRYPVLDFSFILICFLYLKSFLFILGPDQALNDLVLSTFIVAGFLLLLLLVTPLRSPPAPAGGLAEPS